MRAVICVDCGVKMQREESGVIVRELFFKNQRTYRYWHADLFRCGGCGKEVVTDFADKPLAEHFEHERMKSAEKAAALAKKRGRLYEWKEVP